MIETRERFIVQLEPGRYWTGGMIFVEPEPTASTTMAMDWPTADEAETAAVTARVPAGFRVIPVRDTRRVAEQAPGRGLRRAG